MEEKAGHSDVYQPTSNPPPYEASGPPTGPSSYPHPQPSVYPHPQPTAYPHPQPGQNPYPQPAQYPQPVHITQPHATYTVVPGVVPVTGRVLVTSAVGTQPTLLTCKSCGVQNVTRVEFKPSLRTHLTALLLCLFGCWPCVCLPYCMDSCNNVDHYCSNCGAYTGTYFN